VDHESPGADAVPLPQPSASICLASRFPIVVWCGGRSGGYGQPGDREQSQRAGFEAHVVKPVDISQLAATIEKLISR
jgi:hypothetical protein